MINLLTADGKVNENGPGEFMGKKYSYVGLKFATAARKAVMADLEELGLVVETKVHEHEVGHSDRSKTPIEPYLSDQWFVRMGDISEKFAHPSRDRQGAVLRLVRPYRSLTVAARKFSRIPMLWLISSHSTPMPHGSTGRSAAPWMPRSQRV